MSRKTRFAVGFVLGMAMGRVAYRNLLPEGEKATSYFLE
jgi:hypothetical protein